MLKTAYFRVDPRLAAVLGEGYRSSELALKELVDNAWDADATQVDITLPEIISGDPIIVADNGCGMIELEMRNEYLVVANDRRAHKGDFTTTYNRRVKGRKGIGKFAGLMLAEMMEVETKTRGCLTRLKIRKDDLAQARQLEITSDLEKIELSIESIQVPENEHGTTIYLREFNQKLSLPRIEGLGAILIQEYHAESNFSIYINGVRLDMAHLSGHSFDEEVNLPEVGVVKFRLKISDSKKALRQPGIYIRVQGKVVGKPSFFGLENDDLIPKGLLRKIYGEIEADALEGVVTGDWGAIIENSTAMEELKKYIVPQVRGQLENAYKREFRQLKAQLEREVEKRLAELPEERRKIAEEAIERVFRKFYGDFERIRVVTAIVLDAFERDEYWKVIKNINEARHRDVEAFADALADFGILELSLIAQQTKRRLGIIDYLDELVAQEDTTELTIHKALENNLWVFGSEVTLMSSNETTKKVIERHINKEFTGERANKRPDLLMLSSIQRKHILIEFKRPSHALTRKDENQAEEYRDDLRPHFRDIEVWVIGGSVIDSIHQNAPDLKMLSFAEILSSARAQLKWLIENLKTN